MNLSTARVVVNDIAAARQFYADSLGLPLMVDGSAHGDCVSRAGQIDLVVESVPQSAPAEDRALIGRFTGLAFTVDDIDQKHRDLAALGVPFTGLPQRQFWGGTLATMQDPAGNQFQLCHLPKVA